MSVALIAVGFLLGGLAAGVLGIALLFKYGFRVPWGRAG